MSTFVIGDIHGNLLAFKQCLEKCKFNKEVDTLITLGDYCDGYPHTKEVVDLLLTFPNLIAIKGNHDQWFLEYILFGVHGSNWHHGGKSTMESYTAKKLNGQGDSIQIPPPHEKFFAGLHNYYVDEEKRLFIHGGFNRHEHLKGQKENVYYWDRDLWYSALATKDMTNPKGLPTLRYKDDFKEIFIGHTATLNWGLSIPMRADIIHNIDTGAGWAEGRLTIMEVATKEFWQSDEGHILYPGLQTRK